MRYAIAFVVLTVLLAGCANVPVNLNLYNCGSDITCFEEKAQQCTPSKVVLTKDSGNANNQISMTVRSEIQGGNLSSCQFYVVVQDAKILSSNLSSTDRIIADTLIGAFKGRDMTCVLPANQITIGGTSSLATTASCQGSLIDLFKQFQNTTY